MRVFHVWGSARFTHKEEIYEGRCDCDAAYNEDKNVIIHCYLLTKILIYILFIIYRKKYDSFIKMMIDN